MQPLSIDAPCKINLHLAVGCRRQDGFHEIESVFLALSLCDTLQFEFAERVKEPSIDVVMRCGGLPAGFAAPLERLPAESNLVFRAASLFCRKTGFEPSMRITVTKRIPAGAGLGGGSSDAAAVLRALGGLYPAAELQAAAEELGSDVPFFLRGGAAVVRGRGEIVEALAAPQWYFVLVKPPFASGTARAFGLLDRCRPEPAVIAAQSSSQYAALLKLPPSDWPFKNDFLPVLLDAGTEEEKAAYAAIIAALKDCGAEFASLTGSGAACFGVFQDEEKARLAQEKLSAAWSFVRIAQNITVSW